MNDKQNKSAEIIAFLCILLVAVWSSSVSWLQFTRPGGAEHLEFIFLGTLTPLLWVMVILYAFRAKWGYPAGILLLLGVLAGGVKGAVDGAVYFSISFYNLLTLLVFLVTAAGIYYGWGAFRTGPSPSRRHITLSTGGTLLAAGALVWFLSANESLLSEWNARATMQQMKADLAQMETLEEKIEYIQAVGDLPSVAVGIVVDDQLVWAGAFGDDVNLDSVYNIGSIAKPMTASAVLRLADDGSLNLDADINQYLPFDVRHPAYPDIPITLRMLLTHQSGLGHYTPVYFAYEKGEALLDWEESHRGETIYGEVARLGNKLEFGTFLEAYLVPGGRFYSPEVWASWRPGTAYGYSSPGYDLLGYLVELVAGQSYDEYLEDNLFAPLEMNHTGRLGSNPPHAQAQPFERVHGALWKTNVQLPIYGNERAGGGGLYSTVPDLANFMIAHMNQGRAGDVQLLKPETVALMHAPAINTSGDIGMAASGYGWTLRQEAPWHYWGNIFRMRGAQGHGGRDYGYRSSMYFVEEDEGAYGVILMTNVDDFFKGDMLWYFSIYLQLENLLMDEAQAMWAEKHGA